MTTASARARLARLEHRQHTAAAATTLIEAIEKAGEGTATPADFDLIRDQMYDHLVGEVVWIGCEYAIARQAGYRRIGWHARDWFGEIISTAEETEDTRTARRYLDVYARIAPPPPNRDRPDWITANVLAPILDREEDALRDRVVKETPSVNWWPNRYNSHPERHTERPDNPKYNVACPPSPYHVTLPESDGMAAAGLIRADPDTDGQNRTGAEDAHSPDDPGA